MKKITFLALHLGYGGIERCIIDVCNLFADTYDIEILCTYKLYDKPVFELNNKVKVTYLTDVVPNKKEFIKSLKSFRLIKTFKEGIKAIKILYLKKKSMVDALKKLDSDITVSTRIYFNNLLGKYGKNIKIGWEHNHHHGNKKYIDSFISSCKNLDEVIVVSEELQKCYSNILQEKNIKCKCKYIPNFVNQKYSTRSKLDNKNIISVGRLAKEKGFLDLIDVYKIIDMECSNTHLDIIGDGMEYNAIKSKIIDYNLTRKIKLHGYQNQSYINKLYDQSSIYLMTSYTESFGLVLVEAMAHGLVPIAYSSAEGAKDIIKDGENGFLIDNRNEHEMAKKVQELLSNPSLLKKMSDNAYNHSKSYSSKVAMENWSKIFERK